MRRALAILTMILAGFVVGFLGLRPANTPAVSQQRGPAGRTAGVSVPGQIEGPIVGQVVTPGLSPAVRDLPPADDSLPQLNREINPRHNPNSLLQGNVAHVDEGPDPLIPFSLSGGDAPPLDFSFEGTGNPTGCGGCSPPDVNGDVGLNHYIQMVNASKVAIYDKSGTLLEPAFDLSQLWSSGTCTSDAGDPIVLYDPLADRWLLSQFASPSHMCVAISQTADPTGTYHTYTFNVGSFPDYFKFGVWPDGYYMGANEGSYTAYAFDRVQMLAGLPATFQKFTGETNFLLPGDIDGPTPPPAGAPNPFFTFKDDSEHGGSDRIELFAFHVDWVTPANSTFTLDESFTIPSFTYTVCGFFNFNCIRQLGTSQRIDAVSEWPMFRFPFRNFGDHQVLVGSFAVGGGLGEEGSAVRWFELRNTGADWSLYQQGTFDPNDGHDRFMSSIAMDRAGNIAMGYSVSSSTMNPAIRYTVRYASDALGTMRNEAVLINGGGSQTGSNRWGDYSALGVDPADDCSFWYTNEYYVTNSSTNWQTQVGVFSIPGCTTGDFTMDASPDGQDVCQGDIASYNVNVGVSGVYTHSVNLSAVGNPAGTVASFNPNPVTPPDNTTLTISNTGAAVAGDYAIDIIGTSVSGTHTITVQLGLVAAAPTAPTLLTPANGATNQPLQPAFSWSAISNADGYEIEIATDPAFTNIVVSDITESTNYSPAADLDDGTTYYWRVAALNACGPTLSASFSFTTALTIVAGVELPADQGESGTFGSQVVYSIAVTNTGNYTDTFAISVTGYSWPTSAPADTGPLAPGESTTIEVTVFIASSGHDVATVTFTSTLDNLVSDEVVLTTTAVTGFKLYLPVAVNN